MISYTLIAVLLVLTLAANDLIMEKCLKETNVNAELIESIFKELQFPEDNDDFNKFSECACKKMGYLKHDGEIDWDLLAPIVYSGFNEHYTNTHPDFTKKLTPEKAEKAHQYCKSQNIVGKTDGQKMVRLHNCMSINLGL